MRGDGTNVYTNDTRRALLRLSSARRSERTKIRLEQSMDKSVWLTL